MSHEPGHVSATSGNVFIDTGGGSSRTFEIEPGRFLTIDAEGKPTITETGVRGTGEVSPDTAARLEQQNDQFWIQQGTTAANTEQNIREWAAQYGIDLQELEILRDRANVAEAQGNISASLQFANLVQGKQESINANILTLASLQQSAINTANQINSAGAAAASSQAFAAAQNASNRAVDLINITQSALSKNVDQQISIAGMIADFSRDPGDIVANIAAIDQFGSISTALAEGFTGLTERGLQPLEDLLGTQDTARAEGQRLEGERTSLQGALARALDPTFGAQPFQPVEPQQVDFSQLGLGEVDPVDAFTGFLQLLNQQTGESGGVAGGGQAAGPPPVLNVSGTAEGTNDLATAADAGIFTPRPANPNVDRLAASVAPPPLFRPSELATTETDPTGEFGEGFVPLAGSDPASERIAAAIRGETVASAGDSQSEAIAEILRGNTPVDSGLTAEQLQQVEIAKASLFGGGVTEEEIGLAHGGVADRAIVGDSSDGNPNPELVQALPGGGFIVTPVDQMPSDTPKMQEGGIIDPVQRSRDLLNQFFLPALQKFMQASPGTPLAGGVPTPVGVSAPGTNPDVAASARGLAAAGAGVRQSAFERERLAAAPQAITGRSIFRRTS